MGNKFFRFTKVGSDIILLVGATGAEMDYLHRKGFSTFRRNKTVFNPGGPFAVDTLLLNELTQLGFSFTLSP